ncbi:hypothetical protein [Sinomonas sp. G460-2]|uniref:hypothetical protein n=1 Tax=Sinomonas sp. G460-2 TaxID=3393464 RepID=UPI0039EEC53F
MEAGREMPLSGDLEWFWDGYRWVPAFSPDRRWRFDGHAWRSTNTWRRPSTWVLVGCPVWALALLVWGPIAVVTLRDPNGDVTRDAGGILVAILIGLAIATAAVGFLFGATTQLRWVWFAAILGTWAQLAGYVVSMLMQPQPGGVEDDAAGAGVVIFSMPVLLAVTGLLWAGAGAGWLVRVARRRMRARAAVRSAER